jgi:hypothetical protein
MEKSKYSRELLEEILTVGEAVLLGDYEKFNQRLRVKFRCKCGKEETKRFEMLNQNRLPYCKECSAFVVEERKRKYFLEKYGVDNPSKLPEVLEKIKETGLRNYGDHPKRTKEVQEKWMETCFQKYGGHPNQNPDIQEKLEKSSYRFKNYTLPSGKIVRIQGYEDKALYTLLKSYKEEDIILGRKNIPRIEYFIDDTKHIYYPDFFIPKENKIIEVKSEWTCKLKRSYVEEKAEATARAGYICEVWIYNTTGKSLKKYIYTCNEETS